MKRERRASPTLALAVGLGLAGCETPGADATRGANDLATPTEQSTDNERVSLEPDPEVPLLWGEGPPRDYRLLLINTLADDALVFARAGARRVALDTVAAGDSARVDLRVRADDIYLEIEDRSGATIQAALLELATDSLNRWVISHAAAPASVSDSVTESLVTPDSAGYPRTQPTTQRR